MTKVNPIPENYKLTNPCIDKEGKLSKAVCSAKVLPGWKKN